MANNKTQKRKQSGGTKTPKKTERNKTASKIKDPFIKKMTLLETLAQREGKYNLARDIGVLIKNPSLTPAQKKKHLDSYNRLVTSSVQANAALDAYKKDNNLKNVGIKANVSGPIVPHGLRGHYLVGMTDRTHGAEAYPGYGREFVAHTYKENECSICMSEENIKINDRAYCKKNGHTFHKACLEMWKETRGNMATCPVCRGPI